MRNRKRLMPGPIRVLENTCIVEFQKQDSFINTFCIKKDQFE